MLARVGGFECGRCGGSFDVQNGDVVEEAAAHVRACKGKEGVPSKNETRYQNSAVEPTPHPFADLEPGKTVPRGEETAANPNPPLVRVEKRERQAPRAVLRRFRTFEALSRGATIAEAERTISGARGHASQLIELGVLTRNEGLRGKFRLGPMAYPYRIAVRKWLDGGRVGVPDLDTETALRVHHFAVSFPMNRPPKGVPWETSWDLRGAKHRRASMSGHGFWLIEPKGSRALLVVEPAHVLVRDPDQVSAVEGELVWEARRVAGRFAERFAGNVDVKGAAPMYPAEYAVELDGLEPFGRPGVDIVWVDGSPGRGRFEVETRDARVAAALLTWAFEPGVKSISDVVEGALR